MTTMNTPPAPHDFGGLSALSDDELLASTRKIVGRSNQLLAALLAHLGEVEARGIYRVRSCASVYTYCIYELRLSEDAAFRRARAAKIARQYPVVLDRIAAGEIHLTALLMLGPHLTEENHRHVLERAKHRTKQEVARLVRLLDPLPDVAPVVEPLGPVRSGLAIRTNPTWGEMMAALRGPVRNLEPGDRPRDWIDPDTDVLAGDATGCEEPPGPPAVPQDAGPEPPATASGATAPEAEPSFGPERYKVQFTATQEYVDLLEEARDLLAHADPSRSLEEVHLRAMRLLVGELKKRKYAVTDKPQAQRSKKATEKEEPSGEIDPRQRGADEPRPRSRYIPARVRRAVWQRDQGRCTFVDARGERCRETSYLEIHHDEPHGRGGAPTESNLGLRCRAHNALAAEEDFGRDVVNLKKNMAANKPDGVWVFR